MGLEQNIYTDKLTGLPNFFQLIKCNTEIVFGAFGVVMFIDMHKFSAINEKYGRHIGDTCLLKLTESLKKILESRASVFRTYGDEFVIVLPNISYDEAEQSFRLIRSEFIDSLTECGISEVDLNFYFFDYNQNITTITEFFEMFIKAKPANKSGAGNIYSKEKMTSEIIDTFVKRIKESLILLSETNNFALTDDVSGLYNQRAARLYLNDMMKECKFNNKEFCVLFIDGDNLKRYNELGYQRGNDMIKGLAQIISSSLRKTDKVFRWLSGDEFLVILDDVDYDDAFELSERIRLEVKRNTKDWVFPITISIGVSKFPHDGFEVDTIINKSEKANSYAKKAGKDMVVRWDSIKTINPGG